MVAAAQAFEHNPDLVFGGKPTARGAPDITDSLLGAVWLPVSFLSHLRSSRGYDEPESLSYSITPFCPTRADAGHYLPGDLENQIRAFIEHYNHERYHESLGNVTPADAYFGRATAIIERRKRIKELTIKNRRLNHQRHAA